MNDPIRISRVLGMSHWELKNYLPDGHIYYEDDEGIHYYRTAGGVVAAGHPDRDIAARKFMLECIGDGFMGLPPLDRFDGWIYPTERRNMMWEEQIRKNLEYANLNWIQRIWRRVFPKKEPVKLMVLTHSAYEKE